MKKRSSWRIIPSKEKKIISNEQEDENSKVKHLSYLKEIRNEIENEIIIEVKAVEAMIPIFEAQIITYLKLYNKSLGYLINFNVTLLKDGFRRIVYKF